MREKVIKVGDKIRFSTELLEQIRADGNLTELLRVEKIDEYFDGEKRVWVVRDRADSYDPITKIGELPAPR